MDLRITTNYINDTTAVLSVEGRLNAGTAGELKTEIRQLVTSGTNHLILDLKRVGFIDSSGLAAIVVALKTTREHDGSLKLVGMNDKTKRVFELTRLASVFDIYDDLDEIILA